MDQGLRGSGWVAVMRFLKLCPRCALHRSIQALESPANLRMPKAQLAAPPSKSCVRATGFFDCKVPAGARPWNTWFSSLVLLDVT